MSLFIRDYPLVVRNNNSLLRDPFFNDFEENFYDRSLMPLDSIYPFYHRYPVDSLEKQISNVFNNDAFKAVDFSPKINLSEDEKNYYIHVDLPGMTKDQVKMEMSDEDRTLTISGERETIIDNSDSKKEEKANNSESKKMKKPMNLKKLLQLKKKINNKIKRNVKKETKDENNMKYSRIECYYGKFLRSISIPDNADISNIQAKMDNGVLEVTINKIEPPKEEQKKHIVQIQ